MPSPQNSLTNAPEGPQNPSQHQKCPQSHKSSAQPKGGQSPPETVVGFKLCSGTFPRSHLQWLEPGRVPGATKAAGAVPSCPGQGREQPGKGSCWAQGRDRALPWRCHGHNRAGLGKGLAFMAHGIPAGIASHLPAVIGLVINLNHFPTEFPWQWIGGEIHPWNSHLTEMKVRSGHGNSMGIPAFLSP